MCFAFGFVRLCGSGGVRPALRFCCGDWPLVHACPRGSVVAFAFGSRLPSRLCRRVCPRFTPVFFPLSGKKRRLALSYVPIPPGRDRHSCVLAVSVRLSAFMGSLHVWMFFMAISTGYRGAGNGAGGAAFVRLCAAALALRRFPPGVRWGSAPQTAPKSLRLSGLSSRCGGVMLAQIRIPAKSASAPITAPTLAKSGYTERPDRL